MKTVAQEEMIKRLETFAVPSFGFKSVARMNFRCTQVFRGVKLRDADLLEVGAGSGCFSAYAATRGARRVVAIEPEAAGSSEGVIGKLERVKADLGHPGFETSTASLEEFDQGDRSFDVVLMYNVVNHFDEAACRLLRSDEAARYKYTRAFERIRGMMRRGGQLILADCSSYNAFGVLGLRNPLMPTIDWSIHQPARVWKEILAPLGFSAREENAYRLYPLRHLGWVGANRFVSFFTTSHFRLRLEYVGR